MFRKSTVFVIGAGASKEAGLPIGIELTDSISKALKDGLNDAPAFVRRFANTASSSDFSYDDLDRAAREVSTEIHGHGSIDSYVNWRNDPAVSIVAKLAIAAEIEAAEKNSTLFVSQYARTIINEAVANLTWYETFVRICLANLRGTNIEELFSNVVVVTFNYDRTLELFLLERLKRYCATIEPNHERLFQQLKILRPYGYLGPLRWNQHNDRVEGFGQIDAAGSGKVISSIRTYSELAESAAQAQITEAMDKASTLVFLGFGFNSQNMRILQRSTPAAAIKSVYATALGASKFEIEAIKENIYTQLNVKKEYGRIHLEDMPCAELLRQISMSLSN
ncbi:MAG: SIR2 family protein [Acidobacteria bacterium]|nr:SIR2 family protein [Acidobacteriota bacterium]